VRTSILIIPNQEKGLLSSLITLGFPAEVRDIRPSDVSVLRRGVPVVDAQEGSLPYGLRLV
jgi:hypothetical protein